MDGAAKNGARRWRITRPAGPSPWGEMGAEAVAALVGQMVVPSAVVGVLKAGPNSIVELHDSAARRWVVKRAARSGVGMRLEAALRLAPLGREWRGARRLRRGGVRCCQPVAMVQGRGVRGRQMLLMPYIEGPTLQRFIGAVDDPAARLRVAEAVGRQLSRLLYAGLVNRDHKTSNLIIEEACRVRGEQPVLIDPAGLRRATPRRIAGMFARLLETAVKAGPLSKREMLTVLRAAFPGRPAEELRRERRAIAAAYRRMNGPPL